MAGKAREEPDDRDDAPTRAALGASLRETMGELVAARIPDDGMADARQRVRAWQNRRFARTYSDLAEQPRYQPAVEFFLTELYDEGPDFAARDADLTRVIPVMVKLLPAPALGTIRDALAFEALCEKLDAGVARHVGPATELTPEIYGEAFRAFGERPLRARQIAYVGQIGHALDRLTRWPMIGTTLRMMRGPASAAGFGALQSFLERGFSAFKHMRGAEDFLATIAERETRIVERLFGAHPRPFDLEDQ